MQFATPPPPQKKLPSVIGCVSGLRSVPGVRLVLKLSDVPDAHLLSMLKFWSQKCASTITTPALPGDGLGSAAGVEDEFIAVVAGADEASWNIPGVAGIQTGQELHPLQQKTNPVSYWCQCSRRPP